jgi:ribosomal protein L11 methyltransferase
VPYRIDLHPVDHDAAVDRLVDLGAIDLERSADGGIAALMPDGVAVEEIANLIGADSLSVSPAVGRDAGSVWILTPGPVRIGRLLIVPAGAGAAPPDALRLADAEAFGTGLHPTTALCLDAIEDAIEDASQAAAPGAVLDVGTGSGVLALAALLMGAPRAVGLDVDDEALRTAAVNARLNAMRTRLHLVRGGPDAVLGTWPLVVANVLAAPLVEMAPAIVRRVGHRGTLVLSGIPASVEQEVARAYSRLGMTRVRSTSRQGWVALVLRASW